MNAWRRISPTAVSFYFDVCLLTLAPELLCAFLRDGALTCKVADPTKFVGGCAFGGGGGGGGGAAMRQAVNIQKGSLIFQYNFDVVRRLLFLLYALNLCTKRFPFKESAKLVTRTLLLFRSL